MASIELEVGHGLAGTDAAERLDGVFQAKKSQSSVFQNVDFTREGTDFSFSGKVKGVKVKGLMQVRDNAVNVTVEVPWTAMAFKEPASRQIREFLEANLG
ncbi:MAG: polyhydroxyalkanoic acid system family protein [Alphaproteobacteria bacterium]|nr:polyhydroxyalkanoic acid system family protein [Alphaproteobacteria bacterium]MBF0250892.1 polyhydroxyalkanoic acid system family protein [Alphaproteobacteria bacterium]